MDGSKDFIEIENPGEMTGDLMADEDGLYLAVDRVSYAVTPTGDVSLQDLKDAVGSRITVSVESLWRAGMIAPELGRVAVNGMAASAPKMTP